MIQLVILSGKGGTGKTTISAALAERACSAGRQVVLADADVDAANLALLLAPDRMQVNRFVGGELALIDQANCEACGECREVCRFDAVIEMAGSYSIDPLACEGCGACLHVCPHEAIRMEVQEAGEWFRSETDSGPLYHAELRPGEENSGKLVALLKQHARLEAIEAEKDGLIVDGPPGIGCPVISAVSGADAALIVTEPTASGLHDLERILETVKHFGIPAWVCLNKCDLHEAGARQIRDFCRRAEIEVLAEVPFDDAIMRAMTMVQPVTRYAPASPASAALDALWRALEAAFQEGWTNA